MMDRMRSSGTWLLLIVSACDGSSNGNGGQPDAAAAVVDASLPDAAPPDARPPDAMAAGPRACDPAKLPMNRPPPDSCCEDGADRWLVSGPTAPMPGFLVHHHLARPCSLEDGVTPTCSGMACIHGPCGAQIVESFPGPAYVFVPASDPSVCGRHGEGLMVPEAYTSQTLYPSEAPTCPFTGC